MLSDTSSENSKMQLTQSLVNSPSTDKKSMVPMLKKKHQEVKSIKNPFIISMVSQVPSHQLIKYKSASIAFFIHSGNALVSFEKIKKPLVRSSVETSAELASKLKMKQSFATCRREAFLQERILKLKKRDHQIRYKVLIHKHQQRLNTLKLQARIEYSITAASVRRYLIQRKKIRQYNSIVERAQHIALNQKFKKLSTQINSQETLSDSIQEFNSERFEYASSESVFIPSSPSMSSESTFVPSIDNILKKYATFFSSSDSMIDLILESKTLDMTIFDHMDELEYLEYLPLLPTVTRFTLRELDVDEIIYNAQLRHDLYFDPKLQFKSAIDEEKALNSTKYWECIQDEMLQGQFYRVPLLLLEAKAIIDELIPNSKEELEIADWFDIHLIAQQVSHRVFVPMKFVNQLANLLKRHCAPIRDEMIDEMVSQVESGNLAKVLEMLFAILELMKLDYANYQLSRLRPIIIENTVEYEWRWFKDRLDTQVITLDSTLEWAQKLPSFSYDEFLNASIDLVQQMPASLPETFKLDESRFSKMNSDLLDITILSSILLLFKQLAGPKASEQHLKDTKNAVWILINDPECSLQDTILELVHRAEKIRCVPLNDTEKSSFDSMLRKTLEQENSIYKLLLSRIQNQVLNIIKGKELDLEKNGLLLFENEIKTLGSNIKETLELHWKVFGEFYSTIVNN